MPELDRLKEEAAYLKFWQGLVVVTDISLLSFGAVALHREITRRMERIGKL